MLHHINVLSVAFTQLQACHSDLSDGTSTCMMQDSESVRCSILLDSVSGPGHPEYDTLIGSIENAPDQTTYSWEDISRRLNMRCDDRILC